MNQSIDSVIKVFYTSGEEIINEKLLDTNVNDKSPKSTYYELLCQQRKWKEKIIYKKDLSVSIK